MTEELKCNACDKKPRTGKYVLRTQEFQVWNEVTHKYAGLSYVVRLCEDCGNIYDKLVAITRFRCPRSIEAKDLKEREELVGRVLALMIAQREAAVSGNISGRKPDGSA